MLMDAILILVIVGLVILNCVLWRRVEVLMTAVARLANGHSEHTKWSANMAEELAGQIDSTNERVDALKERVDELPVDKFREIAEQEASFVDGLNNIMNYSLENYGLNKDGVKHE